MTSRRTTERLLMASIVILQVVIIAMLMQERRDRRATGGEPPFGRNRVDGLARLMAAEEAPREVLPRWTVEPMASSPFVAMNAMMDQAVHDMERMSALIDRRASWERVLPTPAMDMRESEDEYVVVMALPNVSPDHIEVFLEGRLLTVLGGPALQGEAFPPTPRIRQRVQLPGPVGDALLAKAVWTNGLLKVSLPKALVTAKHAPNAPRRLY